MNSQRKSLKLFFSVALAAAVCLVAAVARKWRAGASLDAINPAQHSLTSAPGEGASAALRLRRPRDASAAGAARRAMRLSGGGILPRSAQHDFHVFRGKRARQSERIGGGAF